MDFSYVHGGSVRSSGKSRYRQWMTHKLATWIDQFGTSGCVGCGRCITWCPVAIDITEEAAAIRATTAAARTSCRPSGRRDEDDGGSWSARCRRSRVSTPPTWSSSRAARRTAASKPASYLFREGDAADRFYAIRQWIGGARDPRAGARGRDRRDAARGRCSAGRGSSRPTAGPSTRARSSRRRDRVRRRLPARQVRGRPRPRLRAHAAVRAGDHRAPPGDPAAAARRLRRRGRAR